MRERCGGWATVIVTRGVEPLTVERARRRWGEGRAADLAIVEPPGDDALGVVNFYFHSERRVEIGYVVAPEARGQGFAARALILVSTWGFESFPAVGRIELLIRSGNRASIAVAHRAGYRDEGVARSRLEVGGRLDDAIVFSLIRSDLVDLTPPQ